MAKYRKGEENYEYLDSQLRMIRQEATVRQVDSQFGIKLYEIHARESLIHGNIPQFIACSSVLEEYQHPES